MTIEQTLVACAVREWTLNIDRARSLFAGVGDDQLCLAVAPGKNRLVYLFGHLIAVHDAMLPLLGIGPRLHPELDAPFLAGSDQALADVPSAEQLLRLWDEVHAPLLAGLRAYAASEWTQPHAAVSAEDFASNPLRNRLAVLLSRTTHLAYHLGQARLVV
jgi:hypothetical protein